MTERAAAFRATFSDWKLVRSRKVVQLVFEVPMEQADYAYQVLGGMPNPAAEAWCAIARLNPNGKEERADNTVLPPATPRSHDDKPAGGAKRPWHELSPAQQAGILCKDPLFAKFMEVEYGTLPAGGVAEKIRIECHVGSRGEILPGTRSAEIWRDIVSDFRSWQQEPAVLG